MNGELPNYKKTTSTKASLDCRFAERPEVAGRLHAIADMMDKAIADGATADQAEAMAIVQIRHLGSAVMTDWALAKQVDSLKKARGQNPEAVRHIKKSNLAHALRSGRR